MIFNKKLKQQYADVFSTPQGKEVLNDLIKFSRVFEESYHSNSSSNTAYAEGMRRVGLRILSFLTTKNKEKLDFITNLNNNME